MSYGRSHPPRLPHWDYSTPGAYFVTVVVGNRAPVLSRIVDGRIELLPAGEVVRDCGESLREFFPARVSRLTLMPDHLHAIIVICREDAPPAEMPSGWRPLMGDRSRLLSQIVRHWKAHATRKIRLAVLRDFAWQSRFHEHVIRNRGDYQRILAYLDENPHRWRGAGRRP